MKFYIYKNGKNRREISEIFTSVPKNKKKILLHSKTPHTTKWKEMKGKKTS